MFKELVNAAQSNFYRISIAFIILLGGLILGILAKKIFLKIFGEIKLNQLAAKFRKNRNLEETISSWISYLIYLAAFFFFLESLGLESLTFYLIILLVAVLLALSSAVEIRDFFPNFLGWFYLRLQVKMKLGQKTEVNEIRGLVKKIGLLETIIQTEKNDLLHVPNYLFYWKKIE